ncbi:F0F1 ATP synthase subunit delta [Staphylococcus massiliensis]|uniref:ATP synthase subunit delta n=1 Tax=Staphylococcus massiliensis S46 TaxID=1229783 RepID=K9AX62_9STAP|nr:F0F1 ATP synthase subunit delta [Staphylococcus massiliensis]EKU47162.1 F0F1 ATP synthase subunit delta [Staphylococcus massiliensis S46]MCG3400168.1 F0F1 ATP synthase subunit delta [Staphylococcus massiliensis]MCG3402735.1 F0F1 ATP synthase subunit delta [Staphylococcus massiliensis]MCG3413511.1 F0F1 ATP synthase subunit delta [Staphylococcus massiliensis]PNZ99812.1 F0F1 ATP synthase subunit delta [Staphylococcus massiliensis CCUG 55927]
MAKVAQKYAQALFEVAEKNDAIDEVYEAFREVYRGTHDDISFFRKIDLEPKLTASDRQKMINEIFKDVNVYVHNMLMVVSNHRHLALIPDIYVAFEQEYNAAHQQERAVIESVYPLSDDEIDEIGKALLVRTGLKKLILSNDVNPSLIGGVRVKIGTKVFDGTVQNDLANLEKSINRAN